MITKFNATSYENQLRSLGVSDNVLAAKKACIADGLRGFEASSRSISMLCHSHKMGSALKVGSKIENAGRLSDEFNPLVAGYFFKVGELPLSFKNNDGSAVNIRHRPDSLRLLRLPDCIGADGFDSRNFLRFTEYKSSSGLKEACLHSERYFFDPKLNRYRCLSAEASAAEIGFGYDLVTEKDLDGNVVSNCELLQAYYDQRVEAVPSEVVTKAREVTATKQGLSISELMICTPGLTKDRFHRMLCTEQLFVPLTECHLDLPSTIQIFSDRMSYEAITALTLPKKPSRLHTRSRFPTFDPGELVSIRGQNYTVVAPSSTIVQFRDERGDSSVMTREDLERLLKDKAISSLGVPSCPQDAARKLLLTIPPAKMLPALERLAVLKPILDGKKCVLEIANGKEWLSRARTAEIMYGNALLGCIDHRSEQGWRGSHLLPESEKLINEAVETYYLTDRAAKKSAAYGDYRNLCKTRGRSPVSEKTFRARIARRTAEEIAKKREGAMSGAKHKDPVSEETLLFAGGRWFLHIGHLDEFVLDLALIFPELGLPLGTAWVAAMIDAYTRTLLALVTSFEKPSYVTTMMLLRECVTRWGRLPEILFMDNGAGFKNTSLVLFARYYGVQLCWRPPGQPRWGAEIERKGGTINQRLADELPGATKILNKLRRVSQSHQPEVLAIFGLQAGADILREWCHDLYDILPHGGLHGKTPRSMRELSQREHGERMHLKISDDPLFSILSLPAPKGDGTAKVQAHDGVQVDNLYYWHDDFREPDLIGTYVDLRWDPFDITRVHVFLRGEWQECSCLKLLKLRRLSKEDLCAASLEIRKGRSSYYKKREAVQERVAEFLDTTRKSGEELAHLLRTKESSRQFLARMQPPKLDDDTPPAAANAGTPPPRPNIPGFAGNKSATA